MPDSNRKVKGTLHWLSCAHSLPAEVRLYDRLWKVENPRDELAAIREAKNCSVLDAMKEIINPDSLNILTNCYVENTLANAKPLDYLQFQRIGYFNVDKDSTPEKLVFNRTVSLKDTWSKVKDKVDNLPIKQYANAPILIMCQTGYTNHSGYWHINKLAYWHILLLANYF